MNQIIKPEYKDTWFAIPKVLIAGYMPTLGINALALYVILSYFQDENGIIEKKLIDLRDTAGFRNLTIIRTLDYLKSRKLVGDIILENNTRALELAFKPQPKKKKNSSLKKRTNDTD